MSYKYSTIVTIDPSTRPGWALRIPGKDIQHGVWGLQSKGRVHGEYYDQLIKNIEDLLQKNSLLSDKTVKFGIEAPAPGATRNHRALQLAEGWYAVMELWCYRHGLVPPLSIYLSSWRFFFLDKIKPKDLKGPDATAWYKREVTTKIQSMGFDPEDDNDADALAMMYWFLNGGPENLAREQEKKKREAQLKRDQQRFKF